MKHCEVQPGVPQIGTNGNISPGVFHLASLWAEGSKYEIRVHRTEGFTTSLGQMHNWSQQQVADFVESAVGDFVLKRVDEIKAKYQGRPLDLQMSENDFQQALNSNIGVAKE